MGKRANQRCGARALYGGSALRIVLQLQVLPEVRAHDRRGQMGGRGGIQSGLQRYEFLPNLRKGQDGRRIKGACAQVVSRSLRYTKIKSYAGPYPKHLLSAHKRMSRRGDARF